MKKLLLALLVALTLTGCDIGLGWQDDCKNAISDDISRYGQADEHTWTYNDYERTDDYYWYSRRLNITYYTSEDSYGCRRYTYGY